MNNKNKEFMNQTLDQIMSNCFGRYSKYIIQDRALPDARDGLKPVQRRILYSMHELGLFYNKPFKKSARIVGDVIGKYHPHGDTSIYDALVRMSQTWKMNHNLVEMHGNNGSIDDDPAAAMRYTEVRLSPITNTILNNIKKQTVLFSPNFDDSEKEPTVLPSLMPNLLINGTKGIAAGYATEMPPHNLSEVVNAIIAKIKNPNMKLQDLINFIKGPDFPTGGIVQGKQGIYQAFESGRGRIIIRSKYELINSKTAPSIIIYEIPFGVIKSKLVREIDEIRFNNKIDGIKDVRDESDRNGLRICIELNSNVDAKQILNYLLAKTSLQIYYNYNNVAIKDKMPIQMSLTNLINAYIDHQKEIQTKALKFDLSKDKKQLEIVLGLIKVAQMIDQVIKTIRGSNGSKQGVIKDLINNYQFTLLQANAIAELKLYRLSKTDQSIYLKEKIILQERINKNENILNCSKKFDKYLICLLQEFKNKYAKSRKTIIEDEIESISINMNALVKEEKVWIGISQKGYIKRFSNRVFTSNVIQNYILKEKDSLKYLNQINTTDKLLIFTNLGNYYVILVHKISESKFKEVGKHISDFVDYNSSNEYIQSIICVRDFDTQGFLIIATKNGKIKRNKISDFEVSRFTKPYKCISLKNTDELIAVKPSNGFKQIVIINNKGLATKYLETKILLTGIKSQGVQGMKMNNSEVSTIAIINKDDIIGIVSHRGGAKRIKESSILTTGRNTQGQSIFKIIKGNPHKILDAQSVTQDTIIYYSKKTILDFKFNKVNITKKDEGFSLLGPSLVDGGIISNSIIIHKHNDFFNKPFFINDNTQFEEAEKSIENIDDTFLEDLLKNIE